ncbi:bifunctional glycosyltransferase/CDP-glycerol:glycerophosphate glycerophosphotransferase [Kitasatospora sp. NPDC001175]|uniref:bifunctional glycosyltransferase/CDP-glycerol:glycerophosphate glycerophosphotransferase n=1 Tax=Kitasatospora sp. NPDC001175 TaxID=3157103 RepID=UPI003D01AD76
MHSSTEYVTSPSPAVSVVIAAYNAAGTVGRAIQSAQLQTLDAIEILVVDDHSQDNTVELVQGFAQADPRIRLIPRQANSGGVGAPRNDGVAAATGTYVMFLDADDELPNKACEELLESALRTGADLTVGRAVRVNVETGEPKVWAADLHADPEERRFAGIRDYPDLLTDPIAAAKLYRREYLLRGNVRFPEGVFYEDTLFSTVAYACAQGIVIIPRPVYRWLYETSSETPSITRRLGEIRSIADRVWVHQQADEFLIARGAYDLKIRKDLKFLAHDLKLYMGALRAGDDEYRSAFQRITAEYLETISPEAYERCGVIERIRAYCLRHGLLDAAVATADFVQRRSVVSSDVVERDGKVYWTAAGLHLPDAELHLDATLLGLHTAEFADAKLFNQVVHFQVDGQRIELAGEIHNQFGRIGVKDQLTLKGIVRKGKGVAYEYPVELFSVDTRVIRYRATLDIDEVGRALKAGGRWNFLMQVLWNGKRHTTALCIRGHELGEYRFEVGKALFEAYETVSGNLCMRTAAEHLELVAASKRSSVDWQWFTRETGVPAVPEQPERYTAAIVVPCHNAEATLLDCLWSIGVQRGIERAQVILVDDGSTDGTAGILQSFAAYRSNVTVISQARQGAGAARNAGLGKVGAPWVMFVDADDVLARNALHNLLMAAREDFADVIMGDVAQFPVQSTTPPPWQRYFGNGDRTIRNLTDTPFLLFADGIGGKLFKTLKLAEYGLRFGEGLHFDEAWLALPALLRARKISLVDRTVYLERMEEKRGSFLDSPWNHPQRSRDLLQLHLGLLAFTEQDEPRVRETVFRMVVRNYQPYLRSLHRIMSRPALAEIFPAVCAQYAPIPDELIRQYAVQPQSRLLHYAAKTGLLDVFCDPAEQPVDRPQLYADADGLYRQLAGAQTESGLLRVDKQSAILEAAEVAGGVLHLEGLLSMTGVDLAEPLHNRLELVLRSDRGEVAAPLEQDYRRDRWHVRKEKDLYAGFHARLQDGHLAQAGPGRQELFVRINDGDGEHRVDIPVTARMSLHRYKGVHRISRRRYELTVDAHGTVRLNVLARSAFGRVPGALRRGARQVRWSLPGRTGWRTRLGYWLTHPLLHHRNIWIIGERQDTAQDNGLHFFRWMRKNKKRRNAYYVIERTSPDWGKVKKYGNVLAHGSLRHRLYMLHATNLISPYDLEAYLTPRGTHKRAYLTTYGDLLRYKRVFLQHGVIYNDVSQSAQRHVTSVDLFVTSAAAENRYIAEEFGYGPGRMAQTGLPRFDALEQVRKDRRILLMPTWRRDIVAPSYNRAAQPKIPFASSEYYRFFSEFIKHPRLLAALEHFGVTLEFFPHYEIRPYLHHFSTGHPSVEVADPATRDVQDAIKECSLMVTDYSSVFFDVVYMGTPLIYVPFDFDEFYSKHYRLGYLNILTEGFGPACRTVEHAVDEVIASMAGGFVMQSPYRERVEAFFGPRDTRNSERVFKAVEELNRRRQP